MQKVSRTLLLAGVLAFGTLTAACGDSGVNTQPIVDAVQSVTVTPANATIPMGQSITLASNVTSTGNVAKTVTWTSSNAAVATVDPTGKVSGVTAGTVTILATSTADASKAGAAAIIVTAVVGPVLPTIAINSVTQGGAPVLLTNANNQIDISVNTSGGGTIEVFLSSSCGTNTISASDVPAATQTASSSQAGTVTLSVNTAAVTTSNAPKFANGNYCIKARLTPGGTQPIVVATNTTPITLNNVNVFSATVAFVSMTGGPSSGVSSLNGLNYNQGTLTVKLTPIIFTSASPVALISGVLTRNGEQGGAAAPGNITFTNATVTAGTATIVFTDTSATGVNSIFSYQSKSAGDTVYVTSATDAAGNPITVPGVTGFAVPSASGVRIDNAAPLLATNGTPLITLPYTVTAPNGYIGAAYAFASGINANLPPTPVPALDSIAGVNGVGGVTTTWYVGATGATAFSVVNSCDITGLTAGAVGTDLANTIATNVDQAKVIVADKLGNKSCLDVAVTTTAGNVVSFGVDKIIPTIAFASSTTAQVAGGNASASTGYNVAGKLFGFTFSDTISGFTPATPLVSKVVRNFFATPSSTDCVIGTWTGAPTNTCTAIGTGSSFDITGNPATNTPGYYTVTSFAKDRAGNVSTTLTRDAAFDPNAPTITNLGQSPAAVTPLGTVTVSGSANDQVVPASFGNLISSSGRLEYNTTVVTKFASVAGSALGSFGTFNTTGTPTVALQNVYRGLQETAANVISGTQVLPFATISVTDVGRNTVPSAQLAINTALVNNAAAAPILTGIAFTTPVQFTLSSSALAGTATACVATTTLTARVIGASADAAFQSQPFAQIDLYKVNAAGELALIGSNTLAAVTDNGTGTRTYSFANTGVALSPGTCGGLTSPAVNTFFAVGRNAAGDAVISASVTQNNP